MEDISIECQGILTTRMSGRKLTIKDDIYLTRCREDIFPL